MRKRAHRDPSQRAPLAATAKCVCVAELAERFGGIPEHRDPDGYEFVTGGAIAATSRTLRVGEAYVLPSRLRELAAMQV